MDFLIYPLAFLVVLGIIVTIHEYGHYLVARLSGVHILRFSIGFGKPFWSKVDKHGTEWALAAIPLGGYLRMLDERDPTAGEAQDVPADAVGFMSLHPAWRIAIAVGGPAANFVLAMVVYWGMAVAGSLSFAPMVGAPDDPTGTPLARAGLVAPARIERIDDRGVGGWQDIGLALTDRLGETGNIVVGVRDLASGTARDVAVPIDNWLADVGDPDVLTILGFTPAVLSVAGEISPDSAAERAGLRSGDWVTAVDDRPVADWAAWVAEIEAHPERDMVMTVMREGRELQVRARPGARDNADGESVGFLGVGQALIEVKRGPVEAISDAAAETWDKTVMILAIVKKMITGQVSVKNLSGPISIAQVAGDSAKYSLRSFVGILAFLSVSIGVFNLLPIPILDGGNIMFSAAEWATGRPVSERVQIWGVQVGLLFVGTLMIFATYRDILRIF